MDHTLEAERKGEINHDNVLYIVENINVAGNNYIQLLFLFSPNHPPCRNPESLLNSFSSCHNRECSQTEYARFLKGSRGCSALVEKK
jgi:hypothetical protein